MKIAVNLTIDVDPEAWALAYGEPEDLRSDVRSYLLNAAQTCAAAEEGGIRSAALKH